MSLRQNLFCAVAISGLTVACSANATPVYNVEVYTGPGNSFTATKSNESLFGSSSGVTASFTYTGNLNFSYTGTQNSTPSGDLNSSFFAGNTANISNYTRIGPNQFYNYPGFPGQFANFQTLSGFLAASASINGNAYDSFYRFTLVGASPAETLTITHDDGVGVYVNGLLIGGTTAGPTSVVTETISIPASATGYTIDYVRDNGSPSILQVTTTTAVPEPSTVGLLGAGLLGLAWLRRRSAKAAN